MAEPHNSMGWKFDAWSLLGWFKSSPVNLTSEERKINGKTNGSGTPGFGMGVQENYQTQTTGSADTKAHYAELTEMAQYEIVAPIIELYGEEATQPDCSNGKVVWIECDDSEVEKSLNDMLERIKIDDESHAIICGIATHGNDMLRILRTADQGITQVVWVPLPHVQRLYDVTTKRLIGFRWAGQTPTPGQGVRINDKEEVFPPWDFIHFRRMSRRRMNGDTELGTSMIDHLFSLYRRIKISVDQMVMYRMHVMPSRWVAWIDTGAQTVVEQTDTMNAYRNFLRGSIAMNSDRFDTRFNPIATDSILFFPKPTGDESKIEVMSGQSDVPDVPDLKTLFNMFFGGARVPKAYVGFGEEDGSLANASLVTKDIRFARLIKGLRKPFMSGVQRLCELQMIFTGKDPTKYKIRVQMSKISALEEEVKSATVERQAQVAGAVVDICQRLSIPNKEIIELVFQEYLHMPREFVDIAKLATSVQQAVGAPTGEEGAGGMGGMGGMGGGGLGADLGADLGIEDEEGPGAMPDINIGGNEPTNKESAPRKRKVLTEQRKRKALDDFAVALHEGAADPQYDEVVSRFLHEMHSTVRDIGRIKSSGKCSLVEAFGNRDLSSPTEPLPLLEHVNSVSKYSASIATLEIEAEGLVESTESAKRPEVAMVKRARG